MSAPSRTLLDTSVVIGPDPGLGGDLAISAITLAELHFGVLVTPDPGVRAERLRRLSLLHAEFEPLPVDAAVAAAYGQLAAAVVASGRQPRRRALDLLIAATARVHGARLATRNPADFAGLDPWVEIVAVEG
ncbi:type II toxin-antitoxin system VapC family toxin [Nocardioides sp.]|uniref:type II toxin-antitoxin system VapC family toxin n=1 Tax=Nocardioides sp. TaxID=35761 RepID=UPI0035161899